MFLLQAKRARLTPMSDQILSGMANNDEGVGPVYDPHSNNLKETPRTEKLSGISALPNETNGLQPNNEEHLLDSKIIHSKYTEEQLAAEPLLGIAEWLNCAPAALTSPPPPKYHSPKSGGSDRSEDINEVRSGSETPPKLPEVEGSTRPVKSTDPTLYVWDLDETLIIFQTLRNGRYAELYKGSKDPREACELGRRWESLILDICDDYFFYKQVENYNEPSLLSLQDFDDGADLSQYNFDGDNLTVPVDTANKNKLAYRHRFIGELYEKGLEKLLTQDQLTEWNNLYEATDIFTDGWLTAGRELLEACQRANQHLNEKQHKAESLNTGNCDPILQASTCVKNYNILVTSGTLVPSLVKCMLFRLDSYFHHLNIYSSREVGKLQCFYWIRERVQGLPVRFCVVGDGIDECEAAQWLAWPFVKINIGPDADNRLPIMSMEILEQNMRTIYKLDQ